MMCSHYWLVVRAYLRRYHSRKNKAKLLGHQLVPAWCLALSQNRFVSILKQFNALKMVSGNSTVMSK